MGLAWTARRSCPEWRVLWKSGPKHSFIGCKELYYHLFSSSRSATLAAAAATIPLLRIILLSLLLLLPALPLPRLQALPYACIQRAVLAVGPIPQVSAVFRQPFAKAAVCGVCRWRKLRFSNSWRSCYQTARVVQTLGRVDLPLSGATLLSKLKLIRRQPGIHVVSTKINSTSGDGDRNVCDEIP